MLHGTIVTHPDHPGMTFAVCRLLGPIRALGMPDPATRYELIDTAGVVLYTDTAPVPLPPCPSCTPWSPGTKRYVTNRWVQDPDWQPVGRPCDPDCHIGHHARIPAMEHTS